MFEVLITHTIFHRGQLYACTQYFFITTTKNRKVYSYCIRGSSFFQSPSQVSQSMKKYDIDPTLLGLLGAYPHPPRILCCHDTPDPEETSSHHNSRTSGALSICKSSTLSCILDSKNTFFRQFASNDPLKRGQQYYSRLGSLEKGQIFFSPLF